MMPLYYSRSNSFDVNVTQALITMTLEIVMQITFLQSKLSKSISGYFPACFSKKCKSMILY